MAMHDLTRFTLRDMTACGATLRKLGAGAADLRTVAERTVRHFYEELRGGQTGDHACALVRFFQTQRFDRLDESLQAIAWRHLGKAMPRPGMRCLVLVATAGDAAAWNNPEASVGHRAIPLPSSDIMTHLPMIAQMVKQFGLEADHLLAVDPSLLLAAEQKTYNVFHVPEAVGSPYVPAQEGFVVPWGIRSVLGFGGLWPTGQLFAVILFAKCPISRETAELFKPLALSVKLAVLPFVPGP
jgi:hypothetical protein